MEVCREQAGNQRHLAESRGSAETSGLATLNTGWGAMGAFRDRGKYVHPPVTHMSCLGTTGDIIYTQI